MSTPGDGIGVALDALHADAGVWKHAAEDLQAPLNAVGSLGVTGSEVSMWATDRSLDALFNESRTAIEDMLNQAAEYFNKIGSDLRSAAGQYQRDDEQGLHEIQGSYRIQGDLYNG